MRRIFSLLIALVLGLSMTAAAAPSATAAYCGITWGSLPKASRSTTLSPDPIVGVRAGRHTCYDRLVLDIAGDPGGYSVRYVTQVLGPGSGLPVPTRGGADIEIVLNNPAYDPDTGTATLVVRNRAELVNVTGWSTFRQVALAGSFEGETTIALGVRARLPFRVFTLDGPGTGSRLVIDVAHFW